MILTCSGRHNPLGINKESVRLGFEKIDETDGKSYEFRVATSKEKIDDEIFDVGVFKEECFGNHSTGIPENLLDECTKYYWQVAEKNQEGNIIAISDIATFETGITDWTSDWICGWLDEKDNNEGYVQNFKRKFNIKNVPKKARLYICGLGFFDGRINGKKLDELMFKPNVTDYGPRSHPENPTLYESLGHRVTYYTYDVTDLLSAGGNVLDVDVADGYFYNTEKVEYAYNFSFGTPRLIYELHMLIDDEWEIIRSDTDTLVCKKNYKSTLYMGDMIDFRKKDTAYQNSKLINEKIGKLVSSACDEDKVCDEFMVISEREMDGGILYDFGVNHTGGLEFQVEASGDAEINICYAEILDKEGKPNYQTSIYDERSPQDGLEPGTHQQTTYKVGKGKTDIKPLFSWKCYRYAWIKIIGNAKIINLKSLFIHMDMKRNGHFECSDETLNRINEMFVQTAYCNLHSGLLTDCPHREKRPYTGDGNQVMKSIYYNMDSIQFFYKWLDDMQDAQTPSGKVTNTVPNFGGGGGYAWGNAICTLTKELYHYTGDINVIKKGYPIIVKWLEYYKNNRSEDYTIRKNGGAWLLGDWLAPDTVISNVHFINTSCYYMAVETAEYLSGILNDGRTEEWKILKDRIVYSINQAFFDKEKLKYGNGVQGEDVLALALGIVPKEYEESLRDKVRKHYTEETDYHLDTGIVLTPILINYLTENGYREIAYKIMTSRTYPSYYKLMENETTFSEHWSKMWPDFYIGEIGKSKLIKGGRDLSHCHPMYGSVAAWLYEKVGGIDLSNLYEKKVVITPYFMDYLNYAKVSKDTAYGSVNVSWENTEKNAKLRVSIPHNLNGKCRFPSRFKKIKKLSSEKVYEVQEDGYFEFDIPSGISEYMII